MSGGAGPAGLAKASHVQRGLAASRQVERELRGWQAGEWTGAQLAHSW